MMFLDVVAPANEVMNSSSTWIFVAVAVVAAVGVLLAVRKKKSGK